MSKNIDENSKKHLLKKLQGLGLSEKEAKVYLALLPRQDIGSSKIIQSTGLHGQFVYAALERLEELGLAKYVIQNGRKKFSAHSPKRLVTLVDEKKLVAHSLAQELQNQFQGSHDDDFEVYKGRDSFIAHEFRLLEDAPEGCTIDVFAGTHSRFVTLMEEVIEEYEANRNAKHIHVRFLTAPSQLPECRRMKRERVDFEYRVIPNIHGGITDTDIWPGKVILKSYNDPVLSYAITSQELSESHRQFFEVLWNMSKE